MDTTKPLKTPSLNLKEAHKSNGISSFCFILWDLESRLLVTASASDPAISIHDLLQQQQKPRRPFTITKTESPSSLSAPIPPASPPAPSTIASSSIDSLPKNGWGAGFLETKSRADRSGGCGLTTKRSLKSQREQLTGRKETL